ncbi:DNA-directed RNA polymerase subunit alpha [Araneus ventricosus]|uniref:DNA-directed RNA polymerase subunit alpha n=1 Tax=Araneus ventricosus TaxID=182803 RepID=A0A4Y2P5F7_ARAVE|nr:DNA-directed RNA polymerase subunit alpha [Araneus ventricosus]
MYTWQNVELNMTIYVASGKGYLPVAKYKENKFLKLMNEQDLIGFIPVNDLYSPVNRVSYKVENSRVGQVTDKDKLILSVETDGTISPSQAVDSAARKLQEQLQPFISSDVSYKKPQASSSNGYRDLGYDPILLRKVDEMEMSVSTEIIFKVATLEKIGERRGQYNHANLDDFSNEINEEGIAKFCGHSNKSNPVTAVQNLLQDVAEIVVKADLGNKTSELLGEKVFLLREGLVALKQIDLRHIGESIVSYHNLPDATDIDQVKRQIWLDILPVIGTVDSVSFITNIIQENVNKPDKGISLWEAASVLSALPVNLLHISDRTILDLSRLMELVSERDEPGYMVFYSASYLTVARTIYKACSLKSVIAEIQEPPKKTVIDEINLILQRLTVKKHREPQIKCPKAVVNRFIDDVVSKLSDTDDNAKRVIYIETLARTALHEVLPHLLPYVYGKIPDFSPSYTDFLKVVAIKSLHNLVEAHPLDVQHLLLPIYLNRTEPPKARMAAFSVFIKTNPSLGILQQIAQRTWKETSLEVGSFVTSTLDHYANSSLPCLQLLSHRIKLILPHSKRFEIGIHHSKNFLWDVFDENREFGISKHLMYAASNESIIPSILYGALALHDRGLTDHLYQFAITSQGLRANVILDQLYKFFGLETSDTIPKNKESEIFPKTNIVPRDPEFWRMAMYHKMFYSVSYNYFDLKEAQMGTLDDFVHDFLNHYFKRDPKEGIRGHLVKLFMPSSYYTEAIGQALPYPIQFKRENLLLFSLKLKLKQENVKASKKVKVLVQPSSYFSTLYTNEILNLRDCKNVGVYHTSKASASHSIELEFSKNSSGKFNFTYRFPNLPKQTFAYHSEAGTYSGEHSLTTLSDLSVRKRRVPIETMPIRFQKNETSNVFGMPPVLVETLTENILEGEEDPPKDLKESIISFFKKYRNAGWRRKTINVTKLAVKNEWSSNTTGSLVIEFNHKYPKKVTKPSRKLKDINDEIKRPCFGKFMTEANNTFWKEITHMREAFKHEDNMLDDNIRIQFQQTENKKVVSTAAIRFSYNRTLSGKMHDSELNITAKAYNMTKPLMVSLAFTGLETGKAHILKYNDKSYNNQRGLALFRIKFGEDGPYANFTFYLRGIYRQIPFSETINKELESPILPEFFLPETHKTCLEDMKKGNGYSVACIKAIRQRSIFNTFFGMISWRQKFPKIFNGLVKKAEVFLKTDFTEAILSAQKGYTYLPYNVTYIDVLTDKPVYEQFLENKNDTIKKVLPAILPPHYSTASFIDGFKLRATNNSYPATCVVMEKYVTTFDMVNYPLSGDVHSCSYVVSTHCVKQKKFAVLAKFNVASPGSKEMYMHIGKDVVILTPQNKTGLYTVKYNGQDHGILPLMPVPLNNKTLIFAYILDVDIGILVVEAIKAGVKVIYDGKNVFIQVSSKYKGELCGLCSDFNGETSREFLGVDGCLYTDGADFAKSSTLGHCIDKTPSSPYICPGHKFSAGSPEPSFQQEDQKDIPDLKRSEEDKNEETKIVMRNMVLSKDEKLCFSLEALPFCEGEEEPKETELLDVGFACYLKSDPKSKHMLVETSHRILSELGIEDCEFTENVSVAKRC